MPMMLLSPEAFIKERERFGLAPPKNEIKVVDINRGRPIGRVEISEETRKAVAQEALIGDKTGKEIAQEFGISTASVSAYKNGATSTASYHRPDNALAQANNEVKTSLTESARSALSSALAQITPDKLSLAKVRDAAGIAKDMSAVMKNLEPTNPQQQNNVQVVIFKPRTRDEDAYETITVNE